MDVPRMVVLLTVQFDRYAFGKGTTSMLLVSNLTDRKAKYHGKTQARNFMTGFWRNSIKFNEIQRNSLDNETNVEMDCRQLWAKCIISQRHTEMSAKNIKLFPRTSLSASCWSGSKCPLRLITNLCRKCQIRIRTTCSANICSTSSYGKQSMYQNRIENRGQFYLIFLIFRRSWI